jgi:hypothetical protein
VGGEGGWLVSSWLTEKTANPVDGGFVLFCVLFQGGWGVVG